MTMRDIFRDHGRLALTTMAVVLVAGASTASAQSAKASQRQERRKAPVAVTAVGVEPAAAATIAPAAEPVAVAVAAPGAVAPVAVAPTAVAGAAQATASVTPQEDRERRAVVYAPGQTIRLRSGPGGAFAWSSSWPSGWSPGLADRVLRSAEELELTEDQEQRIRDLQRDHRRADIRREADIEIADLELEDLYEDDNVDLEAIEARLRELANLRVEDQMADLRLHRAVREQLTAEQLDQLDEMDTPGAFQLLERYRRDRRR